MKATELEWEGHNWRQKSEWLPKCCGRHFSQPSDVLCQMDAGLPRPHEAATEPSRAVGAVPAMGNERAYSRLYGTPSAAGGRTRPTRPATTAIVIR